jgi:hypothetical protein
MPPDAAWNEAALSLFHGGNMGSNPPRDAIESIGFSASDTGPCADGTGTEPRRKPQMLACASEKGPRTSLQAYAAVIRVMGDRFPRIRVALGRDT